MQALWSYTSEEIMFDRKFAPMVSHDKGRWQADYSKLSATVPQTKERDTGGERDTSGSRESESSDM